MRKGLKRVNPYWPIQNSDMLLSLSLSLSLSLLLAFSPREFALDKEVVYFGMVFAKISYRHQ